MSKNLKNFIDEHRRQFDEEMPSGAGWERIEKSISVGKPGQTFLLRTGYRWAAAAAVFFIVGIGAWLYFGRNGDKPATVVKTAEPAINNPGQPADFSKIAPEFAAEAKKIYQAIESQQEQLKEIGQEQPELYSQFSDDLAALDSSYRVLKTQAVQTPNREVIIRAMLQNLQLQAELLSKQLQILNELTTDKQDKNEKNNYPRI